MKFSTIPAPIITKEHGSWAVLFVPMIVGAAFSDTFSWSILLLAFSALGVFMSYVPMQTMLHHWFGSPQEKQRIHAARFWAFIYLGIGAAFILPLLLTGFWNLLFIGSLGILSFAGNFLLTMTIRKSILSDLMAVAGLTLNAPSAYYVSSGSLGAEAAIVWILNFLFFGGSVFYVHMKIRVSAMKKDQWQWYEKLTVGKLNILYHLFVLGIIFGFVLYRVTPTMVIIAFLPTVIHAVIGTLTLHQRVQFKRLGFLLLAHSIVFCLLLVLSNE